MAVQQIKDNIYSIGTRHWDRRLFDELIPLPDGTSYNSYLVRGSEKTVVIDSVDPSMTDQWLANLKSTGVETVDYIVSNHAEQDHSGSIPNLLALYPGAKVVTNAKCKEFLGHHLLIPEEKFITVAEGDTLSLGDRTLEFLLTPWVHWPETMCTYLKEDRVLFSCDFFGAHQAVSDLFVRDSGRVLEAARRYFAEIMMPFRNFIRKNIEKIEPLGVEYIAPSHGPVHDRPQIIIDAYKSWASDDIVNRVVLAYVSMHGSTEKMANHLADALIARGVGVSVFNLTRTDLGHLAMDLVDAATLVLGAATVLTSPHPAAVYAATLVNALKPKLKCAGVFGSYGWGGRTVEVIKTNMNRLKVDFLEPVMVKGYPVAEDLSLLDTMADSIAEKHRQLGIL